jgi:hypothetical protein
MQKILFKGKLNKDVTVKFLGDDYADARNVIFQTSKQGEDGSLRLYNGFLKIQPDSQNPDLGKVIGVCEDKVNSTLYYFTDQNKIWRYNQLTETKQIIFEWSGLNLSSFIQTGIIGDFLYWTDNVNQPRYINVTRSYTNVTEDDITLIRPAPLFPLVTNGFSGYQTYSSIDGYGFQFSYRYVYLDNQISVIAPWTKTYYVVNGEEFVSVSKPSGENIPKYVRHVELLVRRNDENFWQIFSTAQPSNFEIDSFLFSGDQLGRAVSSIESTKPFENIPIKSKSIEIARDRVFLANNLEGYDLVNTESLKAELVEEDLTPPTIIGRVYKRTITERSNFTGTYTIIRDSDYYVETNQKFYFLVLGERTVEEFVNNVSQGFFTTRPTQYTGLETSITVSELDFSTQSQLLVSQSGPPFISTQLTEVSPIHNVSITYNDIAIIGETKFKNKSQYRIGIVFYDRYLRNAGVYTNEDCIVTVNDDYRNDIYKLIKWSFNSNETIPIWAESFQIVRTDNLTRVNFFQGLTSDVLWAYTESGVLKYSRSYRFDAEFVEIDISGSFKAGQRYNFTQGDRIDLESGGNVFSYNITAQIGSRIRIAPVSNSIFNGTSPIKLYYEIYNPRLRTEEVVFYEVGDAFKIINAGQPNRSFSFTEGLLKGDVTVLTTDHFEYPSSRNPSSGNLPSTDLDSTPVQIIIESRNPDNNPDVGWIKDIGRPNAVLDIGQVRKESAIRYSNKFVQGTRVNGTCNFDFGDEDLVGLENGQINKLALVSKQQSEGTVMLCVCEQEALSIYLGETQIVDNEGGQVVGSTQKVIGTIRTLSGGFGTKHAESVIVNSGRAYWWDAYSWRVVRYDNNGIRPISDLGMKSYFYGKNGNPVTGYDPFHGLFFIGFSEESTVVSFDENYNSWRSFYDFVPDLTGNVNEFMVAFKNGYPHRSNHTNLATYFAGANAGYIDLTVASPKPEILENVCLYIKENNISWSNGKQVLENNFSVDITNERGQATSLIPSDFDVYESVPYAHVLRDVNSGGLLNGEEMRNDVHQIKLNLNGDVSFELLVINKLESSGHI